MLDETLNALIGRKISSVHYAAIDYFDDKSYWDHGKIHEVEHGVEFILESGESIRISWDDYENGYGINIARKEALAFWDEAVIWNVTERDEWKNLLNREIKEIKTYWHEWNSQFSLQDVEFEFFKNQRVWFSASRYDAKKDQLRGGSDDISIIFEEPIAFKYKIANYTDEKNPKIEVYK